MRAVGHDGQVSTGDYTDAAAAEWADLLGDSEVTTMEITMRLRRLVRVLDLEVARLIERSPLSTYGDYQVLALLHRSGRPLQPKGIADMLQLTRSGTTGRLDRLTWLGLVERLPNPDDARSALVRVTDAGADLAGELFRSVKEVEAFAFEELSRTERSELVAYLRRALLRLDDTADGNMPE